MRLEKEGNTKEIRKIGWWKIEAKKEKKYLTFLHIG
jgi:hypothetical protein